MKTCNEIQQKIAEIDFNTVIDDKDILQHLQSCQACQDYQMACEEMNNAFSQMQNYDADDALVESTLSSIVNLQQQTQKTKNLLSTQWASGLAATFMLISLIALFPYNSISNFGLFTGDSAKNMSQPQGVSDEEKIKIKQRKKALAKKKPAKTSDFEFFDIEIEEKVYTQQRIIPKKPSPKKGINFNSTSAALNSLVIPGYGSGDYSAELDASVTKNMRERVRETAQENLRKLKEKRTSGILDDGFLAKIDDVDKEPPAAVTVINRSGIRKAEIESVEEIAEDIRRDDIAEGGKITELEFNEIVQFARKPQSEDRRQRAIGGSKDFSNAKREKNGKKLIRGTQHVLNPAKQYLSSMQSLENLSYQTPSGYWANTYLPGDSDMRLLQASLETNKTLSLTNNISQNIQPFDYPDNSALDVYLSSDVASVQNQKPTRMRLQVGIQASNRQGGQRSAMNMALVFDLANKTDTYQAKMKELLLAILKSKQPGDNISLTIAGAKGGNMIEPENFRHGQIQVVLNTLFSGNKTDAKKLNLTQALQHASEKLQKNDDPSASLGSSVLMLFSANSINNIAKIESLVHNNAVNGITLSTVSLGANNHQELKKLALAGQGHARILQSANDAKRVIDAELLASSRAVARALRLRIRLAKGVKLVKVIDSYNLNKQQSQRVRDAEQSLDQRLSKNLGITADRGEDEEGIQIVIPSFFAGDTHVVLLDVVASNPGAIADVSMRYKDLLYLRNSISRKQLNIDSKQKTIGPLQLNVIKNVLASRFANSIKQASDRIRAGNNAHALKLLLSMQALYQSMRAEFPSWNNDTEILKDEELLQQYIDLLKTTSISDAQQIKNIADSMQYIGWRKNITQSK